MVPKFSDLLWSIYGHINCEHVYGHSTCSLIVKGYVHLNYSLIIEMT